MSRDRLPLRSSTLSSVRGSSGACQPRRASARASWRTLSGMSHPSSVATGEPPSPAASPALFATIVVASRGPSLALARLLRGVAAVRRPQPVELLLGVDADKQEQVVELVERFVSQMTTQVVGLEGGTPGERRNGVTHLARGAVVLFLDDDVEVEPGIIEALTSTFADPTVIVAGGPNLTPPAAPRFEQVSGQVLGSLLGRAPVRHRSSTGAEKPGRSRSLTLCNLAIRRELVEAQPFAAELVCAEENELLGRMGGGRIVHTPALAVYHHRRPGLYRHARQLFKYGLGRGQVVARHPTPRQLAFLTPAAAALGVLVLLAVVPAAGLALLAGYAAVVVAGSVRIAGLRDAPLAALLIVLTHAAYAAGTVYGLVYEAVLRREPCGSASSSRPTARGRRSRSRSRRWSLRSRAIPGGSSSSSTPP